MKQKPGKNYGLQNWKVPAWANFFNKKEYNQFIDLIAQYFKKKKLKIQINDGIVLADKNYFGFNNPGLVNVAQNCKHENKKHWQNIINEYFESLIKASQFEVEFEKIKEDFEQVKKYIGVKIYPIDYFESEGINNIIYKSLTEDLIAALIYDMPKAIKSMKHEDIINWGKQTDELFDMAFLNIKTNYPIEISEKEMECFKIWLVEGIHLFATNIILDKYELIKYIGSKGALIGVPHQHAVLIYPFENLEVVKAINTLIPIIKGMFCEGPGSVSAKLYWYKEEKLIALPYELSDKKIDFSPPESFLAVINSLEAKNE